MGRELKRVPMDFAWPLNKVWEGYLNPHWKPCPEAAKNLCVQGNTPAGRWLEAVSRLIAMLGEQASQEPQAAERRARGQLFPHPYLERWEQAPRTEIPVEVHQRIRDLKPQDARMRALHDYYNAHPPQLLAFTPELLQFVQGLAPKEHIGPFSGSLLPWAIAKRLKRAAKLPKDWGTCKVCGGEGIDPAAKPAYDAWKEEEPPTGDGFQLWETTSEGSPASPVFASLEELCAWCASNATTFASCCASAAEWRQMLSPGELVAHREGNNIFI